ncbi:homeobox KN domain-containing protein [Xylaria arbuscula]|nr:homeobox KN domain-containing protein [Xylaria arbuscula]
MRRRKFECIYEARSISRPLTLSAVVAEQRKRQACDFETAQPVIGRLHGIPDVEASLDPHLENFHPAEIPGDAISPLPNKRLHSRSVRKTQLLRNWFSTHLDHPYPSEEEKSRLIEQSGLSKKQVTDWFTNARRRQRLAYRPMSRKVFRQGSPMPSLSDMSPLERWRNSPPDEEPVSAAVIERALSDGLDTTRSIDPPRGTECGSYSSSNLGDLAADMSEYSFHQTSDSASSCLSLGSGDILSILSSSVHSADGHSDTTTGHLAAGAFSCTTCMRTFKKKSDMRRHIASIHRTSRTRWVCAYPLSGKQSPWVWRIGQTEPECVLCGHAAPDEDHFQSHEFESCSNRPDEDRTFLRKDHLWQHLYKFHGCRKWEGWSGDLERLQQKIS